MSLIQKLKRRGILHSAEIAFNRIVPAWLFRFCKGQVFELDTRKLIELIGELDNSDFVINCVEQNSVARDELRKLTWNEVPIETSSNDFGYSITKAQSSEDVLGGVWAGIESFHEANLGFQLQFHKKQSWIYCAYVTKNARGQSIYRRLLSFSINDLIEKGYKQVLVVVQPWNKASTYIHQKYATRKAGKITAIRLFSFCAVFTTGLIKKDRTMTVSPAANPIQLRIED
jgi:ribosomal protein S18 acetylase RimI-like enzyme